MGIYIYISVDFQGNNNLLTANPLPIHLVMEELITHIQDEVHAGSWMLFLHDVRSLEGSTRIKRLKISMSKLNYMDCCLVTREEDGTVYNKELGSVGGKGI